MKHLKVLFTAFFALAVIGSLFAFTGKKDTKPTSKAKVFAKTECFQYTGPRPASAADRTNPSNYTRVNCSAINCPSPKQVICALRVDPNHVYTSGPNTDKPMVDQDQFLDATDQLETDLTNLGTTEISKTYYDILLRPTP